MILTGSLIFLLSEIVYYCAFIPFNFFSTFYDIFSFLIFLGALCVLCGAFFFCFGLSEYGIKFHQ